MALDPAARHAANARLNGPPRSWMLDGDVYELTGHWKPLLDHLGAGQWRLPLLLDLTHGADTEVLRDRLADRDDPLKPWDVDRIADRLVLRATGQPWWVAGALLLGATAAMMQIDGDLTRHGIDLVTLIDTDPARACNVIYAWMVDGADAKEKSKFDLRLFTPPPDVLDDEDDDEPGFAAEQEGAMFMAAMGAARATGMVRADRPQQPSPVG